MPSRICKKEIAGLEPGDIFFSGEENTEDIARKTVEYVMEESILFL